MSNPYQNLKLGLSDDYSCQSLEIKNSGITQQDLDIQLNHDIVN
jgi:hypothetical protein